MNFFIFKKFKKFSFEISRCCCRKIAQIIPFKQNVKDTIQLGLLRVSTIVVVALLHVLTHHIKYDLPNGLSDNKNINYNLLFYTYLQ